MSTIAPRPGNFEYDVALSFAAEQRSYVEKVAAALRRRGIRPFYDDYEKAALWGKDLYEHLDWVYQKAARYCVLFASEAYANKVWTTHERRSAQARALSSLQEYILPVRFDDTEIPGLRPTVVYREADDFRPAKLAELISEKLGPRVREKFFPPEPDRLFAALGVTSSGGQRAAEDVARSFMRSLIRMTPEERKLILYVFALGCPSELPENIHVELDTLRRDLGVAPNEIIERLKDMTTLGIEHEIRADDEDHAEDVLVVEWHDHTVYDDYFNDDFRSERSTEVAVRMLGVGAGERCIEHAEQWLESLDFSLLSTATTGS